MRTITTAPDANRACWHHITKLVLSFFLIIAFLQSRAQLSPVLPPKGGFKIDGYLRANVITQGGDWVPRLNSQDFTSSDDSFVLNSSGIPKDLITTRLRRDLYNSNSDSVFAQGSKFMDYISALHWTTSSAPDKNDISNGLFHATGNPSNGEQWVFIAGDRLATTGTSYIDFEFLQDTVKLLPGGTFYGAGPAGGRTVGDINISMEYTNGGSTPHPVIYRWKIISGTTYGWDSTGSAAITDAYTQTNLQTVDVPFGAFGANTYQPYAFVEAAINITQLITQGGGANCGGLRIKTLWIKTKASSSSTAALKDFMTPISLDLNFGGVHIDQKGPACVNGSAITLTATPAGGSFSGTGVSGSTFTPPSSPGSYRVIYTATVGAGCTKSDTMYIQVNGLPSISGSFAPICEGASSTTFTYSSLTNGGTSPQYKLVWGSGPTSMSAFAALPSSTSSSFPSSGSLASLTANTYSGTLYIQNPTTGCTSTGTSVSLTVNSNPSQPGVNVTQPTCAVSTGTVTVTSPVDGGGVDYEYSNNGGAYQDGTSFTVAANASYSIVARNKATQCTSAARNGTMGSASPIPAAAALITQNVDCSHSHGKVKIVQSAGNALYDNTIYEFSGDGGTSWGSNPEFTFAAGGGYNIAVRRILDHTCTTSVSCLAEAITIRQSPTDIPVILDSKSSVSAAPNPFNDKIRFSIKSGVSGQGRLELFNMLGQKVRTVFQGNVVAGQVQNVEYMVPGSQRSNLIYVFTVGDEKVSGKLINVQ